MRARMPTYAVTVAITELITQEVDAVDQDTAIEIVTEDVEEYYPYAHEIDVRSVMTLSDPDPTDGHGEDEDDAKLDEDDGL
jgi:hypothetical protein